MEEALSLLWKQEDCYGFYIYGKSYLEELEFICYRLFRNTFALQMRDSWSYPPLNDTFDAAKRIRGALAERGWSLH